MYGKIKLKKSVLCAVVASSLIFTSLFALPLAKANGKAYAGSTTDITNSKDGIYRHGLTEAEIRAKFAQSDYRLPMIDVKGNALRVGYNPSIPVSEKAKYTPPYKYGKLTNASILELQKEYKGLRYIVGLPDALNNVAVTNVKNGPAQMHAWAMEYVRTITHSNLANKLPPEPKLVYEAAKAPSQEFDGGHNAGPASSFFLYINDIPSAGSGVGHRNSLLYPAVFFTEFGYATINDADVDFGCSVIAVRSDPELENNPFFEYYNARETAYYLSGEPYVNYHYENVPDSTCIYPNSGDFPIEMFSPRWSICRPTVGINKAITIVSGTVKNETTGKVLSIKESEHGKKVPNTYFFDVNPADIYVGDTYRVTLTESNGNKITYTTRFFRLTEDTKDDPYPIKTHSGYTPSPHQPGDLPPEAGGKLEKQADGSYKYTVNGTPSTANGWRVIDGKRYYFAKGGVMQTGFVTVKGVKYYLGTDGKMRIGLVTVGKSKYYFATDGKMQTGLRTISGGGYLFGKDGKMLTGLRTVSGAKYYFPKTGKATAKFVKISSYYYYTNAKGKLLTGWNKLKVKGKKYSFYFAKNGRMQTGLKKIGSSYYYFGGKTDGRVKLGWQKIKGRLYNFGTNAKMKTGWQKIGKYIYYFGKDGKMRTGWQKIGGKRYYFGKDGKKR